MIQKYKVFSVVFALILGAVFSGCTANELFETKNNSLNEKELDADETELTAKKSADKKESKTSIPEKDPLAFHLSKDPKALKEAREYCNKSLPRLPSAMSAKKIKKVCETIALEKTCRSVKGVPVFHYDREGYSKKGKRILTISLIHGDEHASGTVSAQWISRLEGLDPRNSWRVIPIVNPDGWAKGKRFNANGVDLNRNFPSKDWDELALNWWKTKKKSDPRRYPGPTAASEIETKCLMKHIAQFKPDFIIAIHTPLGLLDFDGPSVRAPASAPLPWQRLGNYPGSLGRYMWKDNNVPVLTIELKAKIGAERLEKFDQLQDISGTVAIQAGRVLKGHN